MVVNETNGLPALRPIQPRLSCAATTAQSRAASPAFHGDAVLGHALRGGGNGEHGRGRREHADGSGDDSPRLLGQVD